MPLQYNISISNQYTWCNVDCTWSIHHVQLSGKRIDKDYFLPRNKVVLDLRHFKYNNRKTALIKSFSPC